MADSLDDVKQDLLDNFGRPKKARNQLGNEFEAQDIDKQADALATLNKMAGTAAAVRGKNSGIIVRKTCSSGPTW